MPDFGTKVSQYDRKIKKLQEQLKELEKQRRIASQVNTPEAVLDVLFHDPRYTSTIAQGVLDSCGGNAPRAASILGTSVSDLHKSRKAKPPAEETSVSS